MNLEFFRCLNLDSLMDLNKDLDKISVCDDKVSDDKTLLSIVG